MITVIENQSLLDISIQENGSILSVFDLAVINQISITDELVPGQKIKPMKSITDNDEISNYFKNRNQMIATNNIPVVNAAGIGKMSIGLNFTIA